jgi:beta-N-acetylhexosaminidase
MRLIRVFLLIIFMILLVPVPVQAQSYAPLPANVAAALSSMTPEERVGQLFLVTFTGTDVSPNSQIYDLIIHHHIGGVVLLAQNDNFMPAPETLTQTHSLIQQLQKLEWDNSANPVVVGLATGDAVPVEYVPLLVGVSQEGNGSPTDQILSGLTPLPSEMAIGATWNTELSRKVGEVRGRELAALGFNVYFGPSLDVLEVPAVSGGDLGARVFGGDPFWVGEMGSAYVTGLHTGSENKLLVVAKHFPGVGGSDRLPEDEVSTVRKSIDQLKQIELAPFFSVSGNAPIPEAAVDGLLVSHIRYQGFQGNIRATTRPISFDPQALKQILALPEFSTWYSNGGLVISDDLGTRAVSDFYTSGGGEFIARTAARDAFLAGNDMLYLGNITSSDSTNTYTSTIRVIDFFAQKYREDSAFAQRVDESVARILALKLRLYGQFDIANVNVPPDQLADIGLATDVTFDVARNSATLISPDLQDLASVMPLPPQADERMIFITDTSNVRQCSSCSEQPLLANNALQQAVIQLYGPQSGNQITSFQLASYSLQNLQTMLDRLEIPLIEEDITFADWVVISITDASQGQIALIGRFLRERPDLLRDKNLVLFSFGAPYYFDTTTISKFTAYYALYSKQPQFVDVAARLLFQELTPIGASPVSISGIGYELIPVLTPAPSQVIPLFLDLETVPEIPGSLATLEPTPSPLLRIGDTIAVRTGVILDNNGHPVPDDTPVQFSMMLTGEGSGLTQLDAVTTQGVARAAFGLDKPGLLRISAASDPAVNSTVLQLDVSQSGAVAVTVVVPELTQPIAPTPEATVAEPVEGYISTEGYPRFSAWMIAMIAIVFFGLLGYGVGIRMADRRSAMRWSFGIALGGLTAYNYLSLGLFGIKDWLAVSGVSGLIIFILAGELLGLAAGWFWSRRRGM